MSELISVIIAGTRNSNENDVEGWGESHQVDRPQQRESAREFLSLLRDFSYLMWAFDNGNGISLVLTFFVHN